MNKVYRVKKLNLDNYNFTSPVDNNIWTSIEAVRVECYPWNTNNYMPRVEVKLFHTDSHFHLLFKSWEKKIRATFLSINDPVCKDSCVEFFFNPNPYKDNRYFNFEMNPLGTLLLGIGKGRSKRIRISDEDIKIFNIFASVKNEDVTEYKEDFWTVEYSIPFTFIEKYFGQFNFKDKYMIKGNFYKCGDETEYPHFGCWNQISLPEPNFHRPECFGDLIVERE